MEAVPLRSTAIRLKLSCPNFGFTALSDDVLDVNQPFDSMAITTFAKAEFLRLFTEHMGLEEEWQARFNAEVHMYPSLCPADAWCKLRSNTSLLYFDELGGEYHASVRVAPGGDEITPLKFDTWQCIKTSSCYSTRFPQTGSRISLVSGRTSGEEVLAGRGSERSRISTLEQWWRFKKCSKTYFASRYYLNCYIAYLLVVMLVTSIVLCAVSDMFSFWSAMFMAVSSGSMTGLSVVDFSKTSFISQFVLWLHIVFCSPILLTIIPLTLRLRAFRHQVRHELRLRTLHGCQLMHGTLNTLEASALVRLRTVVICYWIGCQFIGWLMIWTSLSLRVRGEQSTWSSSAWPALFLSTSAFHNCGLHTLKDGLPSDNEYQELSIIAITAVGMLILAGNTCFPIFLRGILYTMQACKSSPSAELDFLLKHPRRCYTHLFPTYATKWLGIVVVFLIAAQIVAMFLTEFAPELLGPSAGLLRVFEVLFFAVSTRTAGFAIHPLDVLFPSTAFVMCVCMWISTSPVVVAIRSTRETAPERAIVGVDDYDLGGDHLVQHDGNQDEKKVRSPKHQLAVFMSEHSMALVILFFGILLYEKEQFDGNPDTKGGIMSDKNFFSIMFEFCSAWGTVGLSMAATPWSASGDWSAGAQMCLMIVMFLGRLRGLPESIDPSVSFFGVEKGNGDKQRLRLGTMVLTEITREAEESAMSLTAAPEAGSTMTLSAADRCQSAPAF